MDVVPWMHTVRRVLAAAKDAAPRDYTVLNVAVVTLGLILVVELVRHRLDIAATGRPFFRTVLEGVYRERKFRFSARYRRIPYSCVAVLITFSSLSFVQIVATLGCVEFFIFLLHKYYSGLNIEQELVFADVHFTLFFTAIFNAIQSCLLAFCTTRVSERQWVRTEQLEVDHYVEIREEFERVEVLLYGEDSEEVMQRSLAVERRKSIQQQGNSAPMNDSMAYDLDAAEDAFEFNCKGISRSCKDMSRYVRYPHLSRKYQQLLVQIRFHELRIHFLQSNDLPLKFKVSDYLKRSELSVLIKLVHISTFAWLMLLGGVTLLYYFMGIVVFVTEDLSKVGVSLTWIFMGSMVFSVVLSMLIYNKMKSIFSTIMRKRLRSEVQLVSTGRKEPSTRSGQQVAQITNQQALFWGGNPKFIRSIIQFMQFGFAISLSILLVFWKDIDVYYAPVSAWGILLCVLGCDAAFLAIMSLVLPKYTLCTSLGQMVDKERLQETLAQWQLDEARRKQRQMKLDPDYYYEDYDDDESWNFEDSSDDEHDDDASSRSSSVVLGPIVAAKKAISGGLQRIRKTDQQSKTYEDIDFARRNTQSEHLTISTGSETSGDSLLQNAPASLAVPAVATMTREQRIRDRQARRKSQSVGVAVMRNLGETKAAADAATRGKDQNQAVQGKTSRSREQRRRSLSGPDEVKQMRRSSSFETLLMAQLVQTDTSELRKKAGVPGTTKTSLTPREQRLEARRNRKKSTSDGVALMRSVMEADRKELLSPLGATKTSPAAAVSVQANRRERRRSLSAAANIQHMREATLSSEEPPSLTTLRRPRSRQSSAGVPRLEPLVEGVPADHSDSTLPNVEVEYSHVNGRPTDSKAPTKSRPTVGSDDRATKGTSFDSASTVGDGYSDADDIPDVNLYAPKHHTPEPEPRPTLSESLRWYFLSQRYRMISAVFGTVLCFFLVGMRVETMLINSCVMPDNKNTWHINLASTFWMETAWLSCFIAVGFYTASIFRPSHVYSNKERARFASAVLDTILCSACLILLMLAESQRCCPDADHRFLADDPTEGDYETCESTYYKNCCPSYGSRTYGGLGNIEPFTALVVLRLFRFRLAGKIIAYMDRKHALSELDVAEKSPHETIHPFHPFYSKRKLFQTEKKKTFATETAVELWMKALQAHPDLVDEYGEFSSQILQAMLGIDVACSTGEPSLLGSGSSPEKDSEDEDGVASPPESAETAARRKSEVVESRRAVDMKYSNISSEARAIIAAGKLGKPERSKLTSSLKPQSAFTNVTNKQDLRKSAAPKLAFTAENGASSPPARVQFSLSPVPEATAESKEIVATFAAPNARLLRSMRRCDRKLLPLLDKWTIVDVVITKWEIVYFDASNVEAPYGSEYNEEDIKHFESVRQAIIATKGGKGLRLKDVAMGRKVVGHLELSTVDSIYVDRIMPSESGDDEEIADGSNKDVQVEFWRANSNPDGERQIPRTDRWSKMKQDRLRVQSEFGTLLLRFYSDLENSESNPERESDGSLFKDNAFQWCQTIVRLCGISQLQQKLPHFGDDNDAELRDYLVVVDSKTNQDNPRHMRKKSLGGMLNSVRDHAHFWSMMNEDHDESAAPERRISSFHFGDPSDRPKKRPSKTLRRLSSTGDIPSKLNLSVIGELSASDRSKQPPSNSDNTGNAESGAGPDLV